MNRIILLVEGPSERASLPGFFSRWLRRRISAAPAVEATPFNGSGDYRKHFAQRASRAIGSGQCLGVLGLLDLYGSGLDYPAEATVPDKCRWARRHLEEAVPSPRFRQHFAVHEMEAWLLSDPGIFPPAIRGQLPSAEPEDVDFEDHPSALLGRTYWRILGRRYSKTVDGATLFRALDPELAASRCPHLRMLLEDLLHLARMGAP